ncbi:hypothetical protein [Methylocaldum sp.]|uniref:hypothetical protein n=1 Tax=Methylocaldum sp. TaxID=1969727 RepID=UPI002D4EB5BB|nr:hypothetical protein [Methylocaldum sp.]HYE38200.1 hypothetical protein [Methylocaldum sp.]
MSQQELASLMTDAAANFPLRKDQKKPRAWGRTDVNKVENGHRPYDEDFLVAAATVFGCNVWDLISRAPGDQSLDALWSSWTDAERAEAADFIEYQRNRARRG